MKKLIKPALAMALLILCCGNSYSQTTDFTYQGFLKVDGAPANGSFDFEISICTLLTDGSCTVTLPSINAVQVTDGIFSVSLNFGPAFFTGADKFLEIRVRPTGSGPLTTLTPRVKVTSSPYAIQSRRAALADNATALGGLAANQYVLTGDSRLTDARPPLPNSPNYIQNSTGLQESSNFNISGTGTANVLNATQYNIGGIPIVRASGTNTFVGASAGSNATGGSNTFFGQAAGLSTTTGFGNSFFGRQAGNANNTGANNSFFGAQSGFANTTGFQNSFFGSQSGLQNTSGTNNAFFGTSAGEQNTTGSSNAFFGRSSGAANTTAGNNSFYGESSGAATTTGGGNSFFGRQSGLANTAGLDNSFFGKIAGAANTTGSSNVFLGASAGGGNTTGNNNAFFGTNAGLGNTTGIDNVVLGTNTGLGLTTGNNNTLVGHGANVSTGNLTFATAIGSNAVVSTSNTIQLGRTSGSDVVLVPANLGVGTSVPTEKIHLAINGGQVLMGDAGCVTPHTGIGFATTLAGCNNYSLLGNGTDTIVGRSAGGTISFREANTEQMRINPGGTVRINILGSTGSTPLCRNASLEVSSCSSSFTYPGASVALVNTVNQQHAEIESQRKMIEAQQKQIDALRELLCRANREAAVCKQ